MRPLSIFFIFLVFLSLPFIIYCEENIEGKVVKYELDLIYIFEGPKPEYIFTINGNVGFKTVFSLKKYIQSLPNGTILEWDPGCKRMGDEPILSSQDDLKLFTDFCKKYGVTLILLPSG